MANSWRSKIERAKHHLDDLCARMAPLNERRRFPVPREIEPYEQGKAFVYRLDIPEATSLHLPIVAGDLMFNLRCALDQVAAALVPTGRREAKTGFPIFTEDIDAIDSGGGYRHAAARESWERKTAGMPDGAIAQLKRLQPYQRAHRGEDPSEAPLAILSVFQKADRRRDLVLISGGLRSPALTTVHADGRRAPYDPENVSRDGLLRNRERVGVSTVAAPVEIEAEGTLDLVVGDADRHLYHACPQVFEAMVREVERTVGEVEAYVAR